MIFSIASFGLGALAGAAAAVVSSKVYTWTKTKIVAWAVAEAQKVIADAKKTV